MNSDKGCGCVLPVGKIVKGGTGNPDLNSGLPRCCSLGRVISAGPAKGHDATLAFPESEHLLLRGAAATTWAKGIAWSVRIVPHFGDSYLGSSPSSAPSSMYDTGKSLNFPER